MRTRLGHMAVLLVAAMGAWANGQAVSSQAVQPLIGSGTRSEMLVMGSAPAADLLSEALGQVLRVIDDPHTGARWLLLRDGSHPAGPGRLVLAEAGGRPTQDRAETINASYATQFKMVSLHAVIRTGDRLVVEETSAVAQVRLEAVALGPAGVGSVLNVRLKISGKVLGAKAVAAGRAELLTGVEVRR